MTSHCSARTPSREPAPPRSRPDQGGVHELQHLALPERMAITFIRRRSSPKSRSRRFVVRVTLWWATGKRRCAVHASKSSPKHWAAAGSSRAYCATKVIPQGVGHLSSEGLGRAAFARERTSGHRCHG